MQSISIRLFPHAELSANSFLCTRRSSLRHAQSVSTASTIPTFFLPGEAT